MGQEKTVLREMLSQRGLDVSGIEEMRMETGEEYWIVPSVRLVVIFSVAPKLNIDNIKLYISFMNDRGFLHGIIVYNHSITSSTKKILEHLYKFELELFDYRELQYNVTRHCLYNEHTLVVKDKEQILRQFPVTTLPVLLKTDMVSRFFHYKKGDLIRIHRRDGNVLYRIVK
jgi:DNA-directed RNA polymerase subunit H (RpoH/RPB5)